MTDVYEKLRERLDMFPQGFVKTKSGVELEILKRLFKPEEAEIMLQLKPMPEKLADIAQRTGKDEKKLGDMLYDMSKRGLLMRWRAPNKELYYFLMPWAIGIFEFQLNNLTRENVDLFEKYYEEGMAPSWKDRKAGMVRVIPVQKEIEGKTEIQPYEKVSEIIEKHTKFAVADCICRKVAKIQGHGCDKLLEACMSFGPAAEFYIENGIGREITKNEAKEILAKAEESGLIHCSTNKKGTKTFI
jgi:H+/Na+-translocating ferredoxin:NAD+ oxidoreductase subunit B